MRKGSPLEWLQRVLGAWDSGTGQRQRDVLGQCSQQAAVHRPLNQVSDDSGKPNIKERKHQQNEQLSERGERQKG